MPSGDGLHRKSHCGVVEFVFLTGIGGFQHPENNRFDPRPVVFQISQNDRCQPLNLGCILFRDLLLPPRFKVRQDERKKSFDGSVPLEKRKSLIEESPDDMSLRFTLGNRSRCFDYLNKNCANIAGTDLPTVRGVCVEKFCPVESKELVNGVINPPAFPFFRRRVEHLDFAPSGDRILTAQQKSRRLVFGLHGSLWLSDSFSARQSSII